MHLFALITLGVLTAFGLGTWSIMWTGEVPRSLRGPAARHGWRRRARAAAEQVPGGRVDPAMRLVVTGLFIGGVGLAVADALAIAGFVAAAGAGLLAASIAVFRRPKWLIPPYLRHAPEPARGEGEKVTWALARTKLLAVVGGFIAAALVPFVLGAGLGSSVVIGAAYALLFLAGCLLPMAGTVINIVLGVVVMLLFIPDDPATGNGLLLNGWEFAWGASAITAVVLVAWHGIDVLRRRS